MPTYTAAPRSSVKLDLVNTLVQLMNKCLDQKLENEMFREALKEMLRILDEMGPMIKDKDALCQRIVRLLAVIAAIKEGDDEGQAKV